MISAFEMTMIFSILITKLNSNKILKYIFLYKSKRKIIFIFTKLNILIEKLYLYLQN